MLLWVSEIVFIIVIIVTVTRMKLFTHGAKWIFLLIFSFCLHYPSALHPQNSCPLPGCRFLCHWEQWWLFFPFFSLAASGPEQRKWKLNFLPLAGFLPWWHLIIPFVLCAMHPAPWPLVLKKTTLDLRIFSLLFVFGKPGSIRNSPQ